MRPAFPLALALVLSVAATAGHAQFTRTSAAGHDYAMTCNESGYVLRSVNPVSRFVGQGADTTLVRGTEVIYLGRSCDAFSKVLGGGTWCWANGGFLIGLAGSEIGFPRQELYCPTNDDLGFECQCQ